MLNGGFDLNSFFGSGIFLEFNVNGVKGEDFKNREDSKDYLEALEYKTTFLRIGTGIFGQRTN